MAGRRVSVPTLQQWGCVHEWSVRHTRRLGGALPRKRRYYRCAKCALHVVTEEGPASGWDEAKLVEMMRVLLPEGEEVYLRDEGITELGLYAINTVLERFGLVVIARKVRDARRFVACQDREGWVEHYGLFALQSIEEGESAAFFL
jgi:hypothetical protein